MTAKGYFKTPTRIVHHMVAKLFESRSPKRTDAVLDAGCGPGDFIEGIILWCQRNNSPLPKVVGVELDGKLASLARRRFRDYSEVSIEQRDFLMTSDNKYEFIISNPPYVSIVQLSKEERKLYKSLYEAARGRFDLYLLFFEKSLKLLRENGRLVFITPEKYTYVESAETLRRMLAEKQMKEIEFLDENVFNGLTTYPVITIVDGSHSLSETEVTYRDGSKKQVFLPKQGEKWLPILNGKVESSMRHKLKDICIRISCGVATGADEIFIRRNGEIDSSLKIFAYPTISGRELTYQSGTLSSSFSMLVPYNKKGELLPFEELGGLKEYLSQPQVVKRLKERTCCSRKPWYAFHETPPMSDLLSPKILCKDIAAGPEFWLDKEGRFVPRHSVYYIVPKDASRIEELLGYFKSDFAKDWLMKNCQRAANNYIRLQSNVLKKLPITEELYKS